MKELFELDETTGNPSAYEEKYVMWASISYDKDALINFVNKWRATAMEECNPSWVKVLEEVLNDNNVEQLKAFWSGEPEAERIAAIEKWSRIAAIDILTSPTSTYSPNTLSVIANFPLSDYQMVVKRTQELVALLTDVTNQAENLMTGIPG